MKYQDLKDEIGTIICEYWEENDVCDVYICKYLMRLENALASFIKNQVKMQKFWKKDLCFNF